MHTYSFIFIDKLALLCICIIAPDMRTKVQKSLLHHIGTIIEH